jgi:hypothetical protein
VHSVFQIIESCHYATEKQNSYWHHQISAIGSLPIHQLEGHLGFLGIELCAARPAFGVCNVEMWSSANSDPVMHWINHPPKLSCAYFPYQVGPDRSRLNKNPRPPFV